MHVPLHPLHTLQRQYAWMFDENPASLMTPVPSLLHPNTIPCLGLLQAVQAAMVTIKEKETLFNANVL